MSKFRVGDIVVLKAGNKPQVVTNTGHGRIIAKYLKPDWEVEIYNAIGKVENERVENNNDHYYFKYNLKNIIETAYSTKTRSENDFISFALKVRVEPIYENIIDFIIMKLEDSVAAVSIELYNSSLVTHHYTYNNYNDGNFDKFNNDSKEKETTMTNKLYQVIGQDLYGTYLATNSQGKVVLEMRDTTSSLRTFDKSELEEVKPWTFAVRWGNSGPITHYSGQKDCVKVRDVLIGSTLSIGVVTKVNTGADNCKPLKCRMVDTKEFNSIEDDAQGEDKADA